MQNVNPELISYIKKNIFPVYEKNDSGHSLPHVEYVIKRCFLFAKQFKEIDLNMLYAIAAFHDVAHHIDKKNHEKLSAEIFYSDEAMKAFFNPEQMMIIKEAIEDHRASLEGDPKSNYGRIVSSADRSTDVDDFLQRTHAYTLKHVPVSTFEDMVKRAYEHTSEKYGEAGYASHYVEDEEYEAFRQTINSLLKDKEKFAEKYKEVNGI